MKCSLLIISIFISVLTFAQDTSYYYYDSKKTGADAKEYDYFVVLTLNAIDTNIVSYQKYNKAKILIASKSYSNYSQKKVDGKSVEYYDNGTVNTEINFRDGLLHGNLKKYWSNGKLRRSEVYRNDSLQNGGKCYNEKGKEIPYFPKEVMPTFIGGSAMLSSYLSNNLVYPPQAIKDKVSGSVKVKFVINTNGEIEDAIVVNSVNELLDAEALRVIRGMPNWTPGKNEGIPVKVWFTIPIKFSL